MAFVQNGMADKAIAELEQAINQGQKHPSVRGMLGYAYAAAGRTAEALGIVAEIKLIAPGKFGFAFPIARILAAAGETDQAIEWLQMSCDDRDPFAI